MIKRIEELPGTAFEWLARIASFDAAEFVSQLEPAEEDSVLYWRDRRTDVARAGVWLRQGRFSLKRGSCVDPEDLSARGCQYYEWAPDRGRHEAFQLGFGTEPPEGAQPITTAGDLRRALGQTEGCSKLLAPDGAFEMHGRLSRGWTVSVYRLDDEAGTETLVVE